jgi:hypothetical protein
MSVEKWSFWDSRISSKSGIEPCSKSGLHADPLTDADLGALSDLGI